MNELILLTWLHNLYLRRVNVNPNGKYFRALWDKHLVRLIPGTSVGHYAICDITPIGRKYLQRNIAILHDAWLEEEVLSNHMEEMRREEEKNIAVVELKNGSEIAL